MIQAMHKTLNKGNQWLENHPLKAEILLVVFALISGVSFILWGKHPDVIQDAHQYLTVAKKLNMGQSLTNFESFHLAKTPPYIAFLRSVFYLFGAESETAVIQSVRLLQVGLYAFNIWLISRITFILTKSKITGLIAGVVGLLYLPLLFYTDRILTETLMTTFLLAGFWVWFRQKKYFIVFSAVLFYLALITSFLTCWIKLLFAYVALLAYFLLGFLFKKESNPRKELFNRCKDVFKLLLVITGLYVISKPLIMGWMTGSQQGQALVRYADTQGWSPTMPFNGFYQEIYLYETPLFKQLNRFISEEMSFVISWVIYEPWEFISRYVVNIVRFFSRADNPFLQSWLGIHPNVVHQLHLAIRVLCLMGLPVILIRGRLNILLVLSVVWAGVYSLHHIESRYNLPMMPLLIITAVCIAHWIWTECKERNGVFGFMFMGMIALNFIVSPIFSIIPVPASGGGFSLIPEVFWLFHLNTLLIWHGLLGLPVAKMFLEPNTGKKKLKFFNFEFSVYQFKRISCLKPKITTNQLINIFGLSVAGFFYIQFFTEPVVYSRYENLKPQKTITSEIQIAPPQQEAIIISLQQPSKKNYENYLLIETLTSQHHQSHEPLVVKINQQSVNELPGIPDMLSAFEGLMAGYNQPSDFPQYRYFKIDDNLLERLVGSEQINITLTNDGQNSLLLPFDYPQHGKKYVIPDFDWGRFSRFKALYDRDGRLPRVIQSFDKGKKYRILLIRFPKDPANTLTPRPTFSAEEKNGKKQLIKELYVLY